MMWSQISFQDATSPTMYSMIEFHDTAMTTIFFILAYVGFTTTLILSKSISIQPPYETHELESIWTLLPAVVLITLALPSLRLLYLLDETSDPTLTLKAIGHQWYWSYEYGDFNDLAFDSYMTPTPNLELGHQRLLEVDNRIVLPWGVETRLLVTASDVIHAWTIPSMGVKVDAIPGRLNQLMLFPSQPGIFYGQCSEICGANHSFMPIALEVVNLQSWLSWALSIVIPDSQNLQHFM